ncbi:YtxH domain-containing protein [bacterium]|nr:YtxH domain-containing protein [bacterium]
MDNSIRSFFSGLVFGVAAGAIAGVLLAPKSGVETREDIKKFAVEMGEKATAEYNNIKAEVQKRLVVLKAAGEKIDLDIYKKLVNEVIDEFKSDGSVTADVAKRLGTQLSGDWDMVKTSLV